MTYAEFHRAREAQLPKGVRSYGQFFLVTSPSGGYRHFRTVDEAAEYARKVAAK